MNSSRYHFDRFLAEAASEAGDGVLVLDAGAGDCRHVRFFERCRYESADFAKVDKAYGELTYVCDLRSIPVADCRYGCVVCTQVLAHLPDPLSALVEMRRVLAPGGKLWLTAPLFFQENEQPYDHFRFTQFGLRKLLSDAGFRIDRLEWLEGYCGTLGYQLGMAAKSLPTRPSDFGGGIAGVLTCAATIVAKPAFACLSWLYSRSDRRHRLTSRGMCKNYAVIAVRESNMLQETTT